VEEEDEEEGGEVEDGEVVASTTCASVDNFMIA